MRDLVTAQILVDQLLHGPRTARLSRHTTGFVKGRVFGRPQGHGPYMTADHLEKPPT